MKSTPAKRGHHVTLFEADDTIGGQFNYAKRIPGKEEFYETLRYYQRQIELLEIDLQLNTRVDADRLAERKPTSSPRKIYLMQRKTTKVGGGLGKTSGWVHRNSLKHRDVEMMGGCRNPSDRFTMIWPARASRHT
jgi:phytoene dehydrogenase-like protein